jgi:subtilisin family serine protease
MIGSAPDADYWLLKSENEINETTMEMDNWLRAAEFADSVGADVINSSLGYTTFDGGVGDLSQSDMDGNTALVTIAADMAAQKGILVVSSAGNGGASSWPIIGAPADGDSVMAVGGVDDNEDYVNFSSRGPTADGRIKPDVVGMARGTAFINGNGVGQTGNGTSFSSPLIAGLSACLWQSKPSMTNMEIYQAVISSASHFYTPNYEVGYGIPNFEAASYSIGLEEISKGAVKFSLYPNPAAAQLTMLVEGLAKQTNVELSVYDLSGKKVLQQSLNIVSGQVNQLTLPKASGMYLYTISGENVHYSQEIMIQ